MARTVSVENVSSVYHSAASEAAVTTEEERYAKKIVPFRCAAYADVKTLASLVNTARAILIGNVVDVFK